MANKKWQMTQKQHADLLARWKKEYGQNMLDWPSFLRYKYKTIQILDEVKLEPKQTQFPYGNTGVSEGVKKT